MSPSKRILVTSRDTSPVPPEPSRLTYQKKKALYRTHQLIWIMLTMVEFLLGFRFLLKFMAANPRSGFAQFIYTASYPFAAPFIPLFRPTTTGNAVFEWGTPLGMIFYLVLANIVVYLTFLFKPVTKEEIDQAVEYRGEGDGTII